MSKRTRGTATAKALRSTCATYLTGALIIGSLVACGEMADDTVTSSADDTEDSVATINRTLTLGDHGEDVRVLHAYLRQSGYFPNPELSRQFPEWEPVVSSPPEEDDTFDSWTALAVKELQRRSGLEESGRVDESLRAAMETPRCGVPERAATPTDPGLKYSYTAFKWTGITQLTWRITNTPYAGRGSLPATEAAKLPRSVPSSFRTALSTAMSAWSNNTSVSFAETTSTSAKIEVTFGDISDIVGVDTVAIAEFIGTASAPRFRITFDTANGSVAVVPGEWAAAHLAHELGHVLGLGHSSVPLCQLNVAGRCTNASPVMSPMLPTSSTVSLSEDDQSAISIMYDSWTSDPNTCATEIAIGGDGSVWVLGCSRAADGGGYMIARRDPTTGGWVGFNGGGIKIAVGATGQPWVVNEWNQVLQGIVVGTEIWWNQDLGDGGCGRDIAVGQDGSVWKIDCTSSPWGDHTISRRNSDGTWTMFDGGAEQIAVGRDGRPWVVNSVNDIYRMTPGWVFEALSGKALDIAVGPYNNAYVVGLDGAIWAFHEQQAANYSQGFEQIVCTSDAQCAAKTNDPTSRCVTGVCTNQQSAPLVNNTWEKTTATYGMTRVAVGRGMPWTLNGATVAHTKK